MKKLFTAMLFVSGMVLFACEEPSEELFQEIDQIEEIDLEEAPASVGDRMDADSES